MGRTQKSPDEERLSELLTASIQRAKVEDRAGAKAALDQCIDVLVAIKPKAQRWRDVANHYVVDAEDIESARRVLALGLTTIDPTSAEELVVFVLGYQRALDEEMARTVLMRAEAKATPDDWEVLFKANASVFNLRRAEQILHQQLEVTNTLDACQKLGMLVNRCDTLDSAVTDTKPVRWNGSLQRVVLAKMEQIAVQTNKPETLASNWCHVASCYRLLFKEKSGDDVRRCLLLAARDLYSDSMRSTVAHRLRYWVGEREAADKIWPWTSLTAALSRREGHALAGWTAEPTRLFDWLRPQITDEVAGKIASHGVFLEDAEQRVLFDIRDTGLLPLPLKITIAKGVFTGEQDVSAVGRAFACTIDRLSGGLRRQISDLVDSCRVLGEEALDGVIGLLVAQHESVYDFNGEHACLRLGLLLAGAARDPKDPRLVALAERVIADHAKKPFDLTDGAWSRLVQSVLVPHGQFASVSSALH